MQPNRVTGFQWQISGLNTEGEPVGVMQLRFVPDAEGHTQDHLQQLSQLVMGFLHEAQAKLYPKQGAQDGEGERPRSQEQRLVRALDHAKQALAVDPENPALKAAVAAARALLMEHAKTLVSEAVAQHVQFLELRQIETELADAVAKSNPERTRQLADQLVELTLRHGIGRFWPLDLARPL